MADWRNMTEIEARGVAALQHVSMYVGCGAKRLRDSLVAQASKPVQLITDKQALYMWNTLYRFRRQVKDKALIVHARRAIEDYELSGAALGAPSPIPTALSGGEEVRPCR